MEINEINEITETFDTITLRPKGLKVEEAKFDKGKKRLTLVPTRIIEDIADVREFGVKKYKDPDNWKKVEPERYRDALFRHMLLYINDPYGVDSESGLKHLSHIACNVAFLCELEKDKENKNG